MPALVPILVQAFNLAAEYGPKLFEVGSTLYNDIKSHKDLTTGGAAMVDKYKQMLTSDEQMVDKHQPLPEPPTQP